MLNEIYDDNEVKALLLNLEEDTSDVSNVIWATAFGAWRGRNTFGEYVKIGCWLEDNKENSVYVYASKNRFSFITSLLKEITEGKEAKVPLFIGVDRKHHISYRMLKTEETKTTGGGVDPYDSGYELVDVRASVPVPIKNIIRNYANANGTTISAVIRRIIMDNYNKLL